MFTPSGPITSVPSAPSSPTTSSRIGRLRGLSYLLHHRPDPQNSGLVQRRATSQPASPHHPPTLPATLPPTQRAPPTSTPGSATGWLTLPRQTSVVSPAAPLASPPLPSQNTNSVMTKNAAPNTQMATDGEAPHASHLPSIRFVPHHDPRAARPSLTFLPVARTLPTGDAIIRVGRYSERDAAPELPKHLPSAAPIGFKSKVVSRKHCEFWCENSQWYVRDVKSSSGTFLNHLRLSPPGVESKPWPVNDGDVVQLGIDFRGGEEMIFRCVKIRIECNRGWQKGPNPFNKSAHRRLRKLAEAKANARRDSDTQSLSSTDCTICLMSISPCQSLFVAPCSHVWHYKCIRPILTGLQYPNLTCPNCRASIDLEADIEEQESDWEEDLQDAIEASKREKEAQTAAASEQTRLPNGTLLPAPALDGDGDSPMPDSFPPASLPPPQRRAPSPPAPAPPLVEPPTPPSADAQPHPHMTLSQRSLPVHAPPSPRVAGPGAAGSGELSSSQPRAIPPRSAARGELGPVAPNGAGGLAMVNGDGGPLTPRNNAGPFVLDGAAGRPRDARDGRDSRDSRDSRDARARSRTPLAAGDRAYENGEMP